MFAAGCALLSMLLLRRSQRYFSRRGERQRYAGYLERIPRPTGGWDGVQRDAAAQLERQKVELHELAREACGRLDSKMLLLEQLIATSQRQLARMEQLLAQLENAETASQGTRSVSEG
jgi:hypothetical protein